MYMRYVVIQVVIFAESRFFVRSAVQGKMNGSVVMCSQLVEQGMDVCCLQVVIISQQPHIFSGCMLYALDEISVGTDVFLVA